jgi:hypothetical protein
MLTSKEARQQSLNNLVSNINDEIKKSIEISYTSAVIRVFGYKFNKQELNMIGKIYSEKGYNMFISDCIGYIPYEITIEW